MNTLTHSVAVVDDHALMRDGLVATCASDASLCVVYSGGRVQDVLGLQLAPDLVLLDLDLAGYTVTPTDARLLTARGSAVIIVSALGSPGTVVAMVRAGVAGFVSKRDDGEHLLQAVRAVLRGEEWTTPELAAAIVRDPKRPSLSTQERQALVLYASGLKMESVARRMGIKPATAKEYITRVRAKYSAVGRPAPTKYHLTRNAGHDGLLDG